MKYDIEKGTKMPASGGKKVKYPFAELPISKTGETYSFFVPVTEASGSAVRNTARYWGNKLDVTFKVYHDKVDGVKGHRVYRMS
tara:strand:+ start:74 stop:325 length:252 start_codon:yes stop_codon:yes gene_type:complete